MSNFDHIEHYKLAAKLASYKCINKLLIPDNSQTIKAVVRRSPKTYRQRGQYLERHRAG